MPTRKALLRDIDDDEVETLVVRHPNGTEEEIGILVDEVDDDDEGSLDKE